MSLIAWPEIQLFHNVKKYSASHPEILNNNGEVEYFAKIKLHGQNHAVQCHEDGRIIPQSRTVELSVDNDNAGFAKWVKSNEVIWQDKLDGKRNNVIIYGEWIGKNVQYGVAAGEVQKCFVVFAARPLNLFGVPMDDYLWVHPEILEQVVVGIPDTYVLPWHSVSPMYGTDTKIQAKLTINWNDSDQDLERATTLINKWVSEVEVKDPWIESTFGIKGTGEGLVFYPMSDEHCGATNFTNLSFKAKGEKHKLIATSKPAQVNPETAANASAFVELVLTEPRLAQGASAVALTQNTYEMSLLGKFIKWMEEDVKKECQAELTASNLEFKQVQKLLSDKARNWYLTKVKK